MKNTYAVPFIWLGPRTDVVFQSELELFNGWRSLQRPLSPQLTKSELNLVTKPNQSGSFVDSAGKVRQSSIRSLVNASIIYWFEFHWRLILFEKWEFSVRPSGRLWRKMSWTRKQKFLKDYSTEHSFELISSRNSSCSHSNKSLRNSCSLTNQFLWQILVIL